MMNLDNVLQQLRQEHKQAEGEVQKLAKVISAIESLTDQSGGVAADGTRPKRTMSASARRKIAQAQRARWAKLRKPLQPTAKTPIVASRKRRLSPEGRRRIIAGTRARWARVRAQAKKAA
jgi:hypothetical protein